MPTKRQRVTRSIKPQGITDEELFYLSDGLLGVEPSKRSLKLFLLIGDDMRGGDGLKNLWEAHKGPILKAHIGEYPGTRPAQWWKDDAPRIRPETIAALGRGAAQVRREPDRFAEPRKRLGGIGDPTFAYLNDYPLFAYGIPVQWIDAELMKSYPELIERGAKAVEPNDPPTFESEASYLRRLGLLAPGELRRLKRAAFEPETISIDETEPE